MQCTRALTLLTLTLFQDDLMAELEELEQEDLDEKLLDVGPIHDNLPSVPTSEPVASRKGKSCDTYSRNSYLS